MAKCDCYVKFLTEVERYGLHYGAHDHDCPQYRRSGDEVDRKHDERFRREVHAAHREAIAIESNK